MKVKKINDEKIYNLLENINNQTKLGSYITVDYSRTNGEVICLFGRISFDVSVGDVVNAFVERVYKSINTASKKEVMFDFVISSNQSKRVSGYRYRSGEYGSFIIQGYDGSLFIYYEIKGVIASRKL